MRAKRNRAPLLAALILVTLAVTASPAESVEVGKWGKFETSLQNTTTYANPFQDVELQAEFVSPSGQRYTHYGFYDGGTTWRLRWMPNEAGVWQYTASFVPDPGLGQFSGNFTCTAPASGAAGRGPLQPHASNPRWFGTADGSPVFLKSICMWGLLAHDGYQAEIDKWHGRGFNMISSGWNWPRPEPGKWPFAGPSKTQLDYTRYNLDSWRHYEQVLAYMESKDMYFHHWDGLLGGTHGQPSPATKALKEKHLKYAVARLCYFWNPFYNALSCEWEDAYSESDTNYYCSYVQQLDNGRHIYSVHNQHGSTMSTNFSGWIKFDTSQLHGGNHSVYVNNFRGLPILASEDVWVNHVTGAAARKASWKINMAAATYLPSGQYVGDEYSAMVYDQKLHAFMTSVDFGSLTPRQDLVNTGYCLANSGNEYVVYLASGGGVNVDLADASGNVSAEWYNPRDGARTAAGSSPGGGTRTFTAPDSDDWVLHLTSSGGGGNQPPEAVASATPTSGDVPLAVSFDGSGSYDPDGAVVTWEWDFGDSSPTSAQVSPAHTYQSPGAYTAVLTVTDDQGATRSTSVSITVGSSSTLVDLQTQGTAHAVTPAGPDNTAGYMPAGGIDGTSTGNQNASNVTWWGGGDREWLFVVDFGAGKQAKGVAQVEVVWVNENKGLTWYQSPHPYTVEYAESWNGTLAGWSGTVAATVNAPTANHRQQADFSAFNARYVAFKFTKPNTSDHAGHWVWEFFVRGVEVAGSQPPPQPPTAAISASPTSGQVPLPVSFDGTGSSDPDGTVVSYAWDFGPATGSGPTASYTYTAPGTYTATLTVTDNDGASDSTSVQIVVTQPNGSPNIDSTMPESPHVMEAGQSESFEVYASDPDGDSLSYAWKIDGVGVGAATSDMGYSPTSADVGSHAIQVTVSDGKGGGASYTWEVTVNAAADIIPPSIPENLAANAVAHDKIDLSWSASTDNVGVTGYDVYRDGAKVATVTGTSHSDTGLTAETTYSYTVEALDAAGNRSGQSAPVSVTTPAAPPPPSQLVISNIVVRSGKAYTVDTLAVGKLPYIDRSYTFNAVASYGGELYIKTANNDKYAADEDFLKFDVNLPVTVYVAFDVRATALPNWLRSWTATGETVGTTDVARNVYSKDFPAGTVTLGGNGAAGMAGAGSMYNPIVKASGPPNPAPTAVISATPTSGPAPLTVTFDGSASTDDGTISSYTWDFGPSTGSGQATSYTYSAPGTYTATLTVTDDKGATGTATVLITVGDGTPPALSVDSVVLKGQVSDDSGTVSLTVDGQAVTVNPDGSWQKEVQLGTGQTTVAIEATDSSGNVTTRTVTVNKN